MSGGMGVQRTLSGARDMGKSSKPNVVINIEFRFMYFGVFAGF